MPGPIDVIVLSNVTARTPRHLGVNLEFQEKIDESNVLDWVLDSGATLIRELHPEFSLRRRGGEERWAGIKSRADLNALRQRLAADPARNIDWSAYRFNETIPTHGEPDQALTAAHRAGLERLVSLTYFPCDYPQPLIKDVYAAEITDAVINWDAAAAAYEYFFAVIWHCATRHGVNEFLMVNEAEFMWWAFHVPAELKARIGEDLFRKFFRETGYEALRRETFEVIARQLAVLAQMNALALSDVQQLLRKGGDKRTLHLAGPTSAKWEQFWPAVRDCVDTFDYHQYSTDAASFRTRCRTVAALLEGSGKRIGISEFNRQAGNQGPEQMLYSRANALELADNLMSLLDAAGPLDPLVEWAAFYLFSFPATHRNYKSLIYGDMNLVDWECRDTALWKRSAEWQLSLDELQLRHPTQGYYLFRMLARNFGRGQLNCPVYETLVTTWDGARAPVLHNRLHAVTVDNGRDLIINLLNLSTEPFEPVRLDVRVRRRPGAMVVVRECSEKHTDLVRAQRPLEGAPLEVSLPPQSLVQVIITPLPLDAISSVHLEETTQTPGTLAHLGLLQTTRLRAVAGINGEAIDIGGLSVRWESSHPLSVRVTQTGLVQRLRNVRETVTIRALDAQGRLLAETKVPPLP